MSQRGLLHLPIKTNILGDSHILFYFCDGLIKMTHRTQKRKKSWTWKHSPLISWNMNTRVIWVSLAWYVFMGFNLLCVSFFQFFLEELFHHKNRPNMLASFVMFLCCNFQQKHDPLSLHHAHASQRCISPLKIKVFVEEWHYYKCCLLCCFLIKKHT